ncbi:hypothetical protein AWW66_26620 [Micromonospora rosaria]|uniref:CRISPR-associated protein Cmr3 n=1 Tax=Micromonospora rosaria TaxID=47874 RepID=A0A136PKW4_9ACTN|nr:type III-B CRISPR module-associated Cmr3 family protein [Micromonospora rosaria]KXK59007.1 hypothetical protein AWW66_26620 [Micromonospora rosaria]
MSGRRWLVLEPHDTVSVRDGRAFDAGVQTVGRAVPPHPATVAGAVGAAFGAPPGAGVDPAQRGVLVPAELHGPVVLRRRTSGRWRAWFPMPRVVVRVDADWRRLTPGNTRLDGVRHDLSDEVDLLGGPQGEPGGWLDGSALGRFLADPLVVPRDAGPPWVWERRVGLARDDARTARDGMLYSVEHLRPAVDASFDGFGFAVGCVSAPPHQLRETVPLGGEGRRATVHDWTDAGDLGPLPAAPADVHTRVLLYLATPAVFGDGWRPAADDLRGARLVAAAVGGPQPVAMGRPDPRTGELHARRLVWAAPAGSVYFLDFDGDAAAAREAVERWHGHAFAQSDETLRTAGFGLTLTGRW